jgi:hypothetical protein
MCGWITGSVKIRFLLRTVSARSAVPVRRDLAPWAGRVVAQAGARYALSIWDWIYPHFLSHLLNFRRSRSEPHTAHLHPAVFQSWRASAPGAVHFNEFSHRVPPRIASRMELTGIRLLITSLTPRLNNHGS